MLAPKTLNQNILLWVGAFLTALLLAFINSLIKQLPGDLPINWRTIAFDVLTTVSTTVPIIAAGLGLPALGKELETRLISKVGTDTAKEVLQDAATGNTKPREILYNTGDVTVQEMARSLLAEIKRIEEVDRFKQ
jgi:hypothetical protein